MTPTEFKIRIGKKRNKMTKKFPKLTVGNVNYWYWSCDPAWSGLDIAKAVGSNYSSTIYKFMEKNHIPRRRSEEAAKNMYKCNFKVDHILDGHRTTEYRVKISQISKAMWSDPLKRKLTVNNLKEALKENRKFPSLTVENVNNWYWNQTPLWSTQDIADYLGCAQATVYNFMKKHNIPMRERSVANAVVHNHPVKRKNYEDHVRLGKNQRTILEILVKHQYLFPSDFKKKRLIKDLTTRKIRRSLYLMYNRQLVSREKKFEGNKYNKYQFSYSLTRKGLRMLNNFD